MANSVVPKILIASTSTVHGKPYLEYATELIAAHFDEVAKVLFIPFARPGGISHDEYTSIAANYFGKLGIEVRGAHEFMSCEAAIEWAGGVFVGGGSTFVLVNELHQAGWMDSIRKAVMNGMPYMGTSAGSNVTGMTMCTTNDMPIVYPPSFETMGFVPFNINPHYLDPDPTSKHMGETRETRIKEFHAFNKLCVVGLREGSCLWLRGSHLSLTGELPMRVFEHGKEPREVESGSDLSFLMI
ncbi:MAG: dipeptidase E [Flavobacteriales bacterium]|jgi:dipeptidase E